MTTTAQAIHDTLQSTNVCDSNGEIANVVDTLDNLARSGFSIARAIKPSSAPGRDAVGGHVESLTESVMGITAALDNCASALTSIANSLDNIAAAIHETKQG